MPIIEVSHLTKRYGAFEAVADLSFSVDKGTVVGFLGPNGAGKSTTLRIISGFLGASAGTVRVDGLDIVDEPLKARRQIGYMPESSPLYPEMRVVEYLGFRAELKRIPSRKRRAEVARALSLARVADMAGKLIGQLSKGYRQRVGLADALLGSPPLLILDEPTAGLDPNQIREVRSLVAELSADHTVLLSTHILSEVEAICSRAIVIAKGRLVAEGPLDAIRASGPPILRLTVSGSGKKALRILREHEAVAEARAERCAEERLFDLTVSLRDPGVADAGPLTEALVRELVRGGLGVRRVVPAGASLEEVFTRLTTAEVLPPEVAP